MLAIHHAFTRMLVIHHDLTMILITTMHGFSWVFMLVSPAECRTLGELGITEVVNPVSGGQEVTVHISGDGFLYHMVRA